MVKVWFVYPYTHARNTYNTPLMQWRILKLLVLHVLSLLDLSNFSNIFFTEVKT